MNQDHLKNPLPPLMLDIPKDCTLASNPHAPRLTAEQCAIAINCLIRDDGPRKLTPYGSTGVKGSSGNEWVEATAQWESGLYHFCFFYRNGQLTNCFRMKTPKGAEYDINLDGGSPFHHLIEQDKVMLTSMLVGSKMDNEIEVVQSWVISINGWRPASAIIYYTKEDAEAAAELQRTLRKKYAKVDADKESQSTEKALAKERSTVAFKPKSKGLTKTKK